VFETQKPKEKFVMKLSQTLLLAAAFAVSGGAAASETVGG
jgi:hypothetical protein